MFTLQKFRHCRWTHRLTCHGLGLSSPRSLNTMLTLLIALVGCDPHSPPREVEDDLTSVSDMSSMITADRGIDLGASTSDQSQAPDPDLSVTDADTTPDMAPELDGSIDIDSGIPPDMTLEPDLDSQWDPPTITPLETRQAWRGETIDISALVHSEDPRGLSLTWRQVLGDAQLYSEDGVTLTIGPLEATHRSQLSFTLEVVDSRGRRAEVTIHIEVLDRLEFALEEGDSRPLIEDAVEQSEADLLTKIIVEIDAQRAQQAEVLTAIYADDEIIYDPTRHSQFFTRLGLSNASPLVIGQRGTLLATLYQQGSLRGAAFGSDLLERLDQGFFAEMEPMIERLLTWLLRRDDLSREPSDPNPPPMTRVIRLVGLSSTSATRSTRYLNARSGAWEASACTDLQTLITCAAAAHLVVIGSGGDITPEVLLNVVDAAQSRGASLLYVHQHSWNSVEVTQSLLARLGVTIQPPGGPGNYFSRDTASWSNVTEMLNQVGDLSSLRELATRARDDTFSFNISDCGEQGCDELEGYRREFGIGATRVRSLNRDLDQRGHSLFSAEGERLHKLLVVLGDLWRAQVRFPMDKTITPTLDFLKSYYADHAALLTRLTSPGQADLGNFSRSDFSHITPQDLTRTYVSKRPSRAAQVYALPGQTLRVTRLDQSEVQVSVQINSLRDGSTHPFKPGEYVRPKFLASAAVPLHVDQPLTLTSPHGGPVQLRFDRNDEEVTIAFEGVGQHPVWRDPSDDERFQTEIDASDYDWVEVITSHFEIHSTVEKINETLSNPLANTGSELESLIQTYHHGLSLALAGYQGPGIPVIPEIVDYATERGWTLSDRDVVQHFNADQPTCGYGCSGNPYDAGWAFTPLGHGDLHEVGHNHERGLFKFNGREIHAHTNFYSYYPKQRHELDTGITADCQNLPFSALFSKLQRAALSADPYATMHDDLELLGWSQGATMVIQMLMAAQQRGAVEVGWHLIGRLHVHERLFRAARDDQERWLNARDTLGFSTWSRNQAESISNNDYLLVAMGAVSELDFQEYFQMWGLEISPEAAAQISLNNYPEVERVYYAAEPKDACALWSAREVSVDGRSLWIDLSLYERIPVNLNADYRSEPLNSEASSVYFLALDAAVGPTERVWWGQDGERTELRIIVKREGSDETTPLIIDAYQQRCDTLMTLNAGRVGGCEHRIVLSVDPLRNAQLISGARYTTLAESPLVLLAWRWHEPEILIDTLVLDLTYNAL